MEAHRSILLIGRSGTGKTTIVVQRLWHNFKRNHDHAVSVPDAPRLHQLFVTANPILRNSVSKSFAALHSGYVAGAGEGEAELAGEESLTSLRGLGDDAWPLFLRAHNWLRLLDATLQRPFFSAAERSAAAAKNSGWHSEAGVMDSLLEEEDDESEYEEDDDEDEDEDEDGDEVEGDAAGSAAQHGRREKAPRMEMTYDVFESMLWPHMLMHKASAAHKLSKQQLVDQARGAQYRDAVEKAPLKASMVR